MKTMMILMSIFALNFNAEAASTTLPVDALSLRSVEGTVVSVRELCPPNAICVTNGTVVELEFRLTGCMNRIQAVNSLAVEDGKNLNVYVQALEVHTQGSNATKCSALPVDKMELTFINQYGDVKVEFLKAPEYQVQSGDMAVQPIVGEVVSTERLCPPVMKNCLVDGTEIVLEYVPTGCLDHMTDIAVKTAGGSPTSNDLDVFFSRFSILNKKSLTAFCTQVLKRDSVQLIDEFGTVVEHHLR